MFSCRLFRIRKTRLVILPVFGFLTVVLYDRYTDLFTIDARPSPFIRSFSLSGVHARGIFSNSLQNIRHNATQVHTKLIAKHPFLMNKIINPHDFQYLIRPNVTCSDRDVELTICVSITSVNQAGRSVIRSTWGSYAKDPNNKAVLLFFIGSENEESETESRLVRQSRLQEEASTFGDIVQENYIDSYRNLTLKSVSILRWVNSFCPQTKYILKVDDDVYVNIPLLMRILQEFIVQSSPPTAFITGHMEMFAFPYRDPKSKWYIPYSTFGEFVFPNYVIGPAYVMTSEAAVLIYEASLRVARVWLEDAYITGICASKAGVRVYDSKYFIGLTLLASGCSFRTMVSSHKYTLEEMVKIHTELYDPNLNC